MLKFLQVSDFAKAGLNSDMMPWDLPPSFLTNINNVRVTRGRLTPFGGGQHWADLPASFIPGHLMHVGSLSSDFWLVLGKDSVYVWDSLTFTDISIATYPGSLNEDEWTSCMISRIPVINNPSYYPEYWSLQSLGVMLTALPWDATQTWQAANQSCRIIRSHKQFLFALDITSNGNEIPDGVRWSAPADIGSVPPSWDELDTTGSAGLTFLGGSGGAIVDGMSLRDAFCVYRETGISVFDYVGGQFIWRVRHLSDTVGLVSKDCIVEVKGVHLFIGNGDIYSNDGSTITSLLHNRIRKRFMADLDPVNFVNSYAVKNTASSEVWFCIPSAGAVYPTVAYIFNWEDNTWAIRDLPDICFATSGEQSTPAETWSTIAGIWGNGTLSWNERSISPLQETVVGIIKPVGIDDGKLMFLDKGAISDYPYNSIIERTGLAIDGIDDVVTITRVYPHIDGAQAVSIQIGSQTYPGAPINWKPAVQFNPVTDRKVDIRSTGALHCFRITSTGTSSSWSLSGLDIEYVGAGKR